MKFIELHSPADRLATHNTRFARGAGSAEVPYDPDPIPQSLFPSNQHRLTLARRGKGSQARISND
ncbi:MAG: hypothetical protein P8Z75_14755 [Gammaproteobacteria bacterium]